MSQTVLDLFAGSGSLGIEALSWGAERAVFVDIKKSSLDAVRKNLASLGQVNFGEVYLKDSLSAVKDFHWQKRRFGLIFLDPPYYKGLITKSLKILEAYDIVEPSGFVVSLGWRKESAENKGFLCVFERQYGGRLVRVLKPFKEPETKTV